MEAPAEPGDVNRREVKQVMTLFVRTPRGFTATVRQTLIAATRIRATGFWGTCISATCICLGAGAAALARTGPAAQSEQATAPLVLAQQSQPERPQAARQKQQGNPRISEVAGRYAVLREDNKDTLCMVTLFATPRGRGYHRAQLAPACRDNGIVIFDPVAWTIDRQGHLSLQARKGHKMLLERDADGVWRRTEQKARPLGLSLI